MKHLLKAISKIQSVSQSQVHCREMCRDDLKITILIKLKSSIIILINRARERTDDNNRSENEPFFINCYQSSLNKSTAQISVTDKFGPNVAEYFE